MTGSPSRCAALCFALALGLPFRGQAAPVCELQQAASWYTTITAGVYRLLFDDESGPGPDRIERPLHGFAFYTDTDSFRITGPHGTCWAAPEVGIVTMPVFIGNGRYLYIPTYSGSDGYLFVVDAQSCKTLWQSPDTQGDAVRTPDGFFLPGAGQVVIKPDCLPRIAP